MEKRNKKKPFLLYLSYYNIHTPIQPYKKRIDHYKEKAKKTFEGNSPMCPEHEGKTRLRQDNPALASMVAAVDDSVGALLDKLESSGIAEETTVIFFQRQRWIKHTPRTWTGVQPTLASRQRLAV